MVLLHCKPGLPIRTDAGVDMNSNPGRWDAAEPVDREHRSMVDQRVKPGDGFTRVLIATAVAGVFGYLITWWVARQIGLSAYAVFAVFWALTYLVIGSLSGIQQEIARASHPVTIRAESNSRGLIFGAAVALIVVAVILGTAPAWVDSAFPIQRWALVWPLAVGAASFVFTAVVSGTFYGIAAWRVLSGIIILDPALRLACLVVGLLFTKDVSVLAWLVALPIPATIAILSPWIRSSLRGHSRIDAGYKRLFWNSARVVVAAAALSLMVSGFPFVIGVTSQGDNASDVGLLILAITLSRAPLVVTAMALQSYLVVHFRDLRTSARRSFLRIQGIVAAAAIVIGSGAWLIGPWIFAVLFPENPAPEGWLLAVLVVSSAIVASMCVSASALLARSQHLAFSLGWAIAAVVTVGCELAPADLVPRTLLALLVGPIAGLVVHLSFLARHVARSSISATR